jgi:hypothetical protein
VRAVVALADEALQHRFFAAMRCSSASACASLERRGSAIGARAAIARGTTRRSAPARRGADHRQHVALVLGSMPMWRATNSPAFRVRRGGACSDGRIKGKEAEGREGVRGVDRARGRISCS